MHAVSPGLGTAGPAGSTGGTGRRTGDLPRLPSGLQVLQAVLTYS